jgi:hypothetical protein
MVITFRHIQQVVPLLARRNDGAGGVGSIREVEDRVEKTDRTIVPDSSMTKNCENLFAQSGAVLSGELAETLFLTPSCSQCRVSGPHFDCCGGPGSRSASNPTFTITSVTASCSAATIQSGQTNQCTASVQGTGNFSSSVTWAASAGTISSSGLYTPSTVRTSTQVGTHVQPASLYLEQLRERRGPAAASAIGYP